MHVAMIDFTAAIERIVASLEKRNRLLNPHERKVVAHHEMGHALVAAALPGTDLVHKVSILPRGVGALGYTIQRPTEDRYLMSRAEIENKMAVLLGGRAAEHIVFDELSTGASDDLAKATEIAMTMVTRYAMVPELGNMTYDSEPPGQPAARRAYSEQTAREIYCAAREIIERASRHARRILERNREGASGRARDAVRERDAERGRAGRRLRTAREGAASRLRGLTAAPGSCDSVAPPPPLCDVRRVRRL
jgi:cell division protease FtsH